MLLKRLKLRTLMRLMAWSTCRYSESTEHSSRLKIRENTVGDSVKRRAVNTMSNILGQLSRNLLKKVAKLRTIMPADAALQPMIISWKYYDCSTGYPLIRSAQMSVTTALSSQGRMLQMKKHEMPVCRDLVLRRTIVMMTWRVVGPGRHQQSSFIYRKEDSLSHLDVVTSLSWVKLRWFCWSPTFWQDSSQMTLTASSQVVWSLANDILGKLLLSRSIY